MSTLDWMPELAAALDKLVPLEDGSRANWDDVVGRVGKRRGLWRVRGRHPRLRLAVVVVLLLLLLSGIATATYLLVRNNGDIALGGGAGELLVVNPSVPGLHAIARCSSGSPACVISGPAYSRDGTLLAFVGGRAGGMTGPDHLSVYVTDASGKSARRLVRCGSCENLSWSPNGKWIAFSRYAGRQMSVWIVAAGGGKLHRLTDCHAPCADDQSEWSPDGRQVVFTRSVRTPGASGIYTIHPDGSGLTKVVNGWGYPVWSPDGRRIAFDSGSDSIAVVDADGSHLHVLFSGARGTGPGAPSWSPDGRKLLFFKTPHPPGRPHAGYLAEVWTMNPSGSDKERLYRSGCCVGSWARPIWAPNGRLIAFSADSAGGTFVINADGTGLRRLSPITFSELSWQPLAKGQQSAPPPTHPLVITAKAPAPWRPYRLPPARSCLIRDHARLRPSKDTFSSVIQWVLARNSLGPSVWINVTFAPDPSQAAIYERSAKSELRTTLTVGSAWIRHHITRRRNVVIENDFPAHPLTATQLATITDCLHG